MKMCHVVPWFPSLNPTTPGARQGLFEYRQIEKLSERGHEFKVVSMMWDGQTPYEQINNQVHVYRIPYYFSIARYPLPSFIKLNRILNEICKCWNPDIVVFSHMQYLIALPILYLKSVNVKPTIVTIDALPGITWFCDIKLIDTIGYLHSIIIGKKIFQVADGIHVLASNLHDYINNIKKDNVFIIPRGVDTDVFKPQNSNLLLRKQLGIEENDFVGLYVGRLDPVKGVGYLIEAVNEVIPLYNNFKLIIVGDGSLRSKYEASVNNNITDNVIFTGYKDNIPEILNISDFFIMPSLSEGAANAVLEASASGLPVIATRVGEIPNIVDDGRTGLLVNPRDVDALVKSMIILIDNPLLAKDMGNLGRERIVKHYSWNIICKNIENHYSMVIDKKQLQFGS